MENKYFIPSIEDIRVGYECESFDDRLQDPNNIKWVKCILDDWEDVQYIIEDLSWRVRVPYLTGEQILNEGFQIAFGKDRYFKGRTEIDLLSENTVLISQNGSVVFCGECKDINTFRQVMKLLGI